jgi:RNA polymerase sigma factor (sigma-70 family)
MADAPLGVVLRQVRRMAAGEGLADATDAQLLERFRARREEAAFAALLHRHGPMVLGVARRLLRQEQDAEDVFQATFLLLARKAGSIRKREAVGSWLHGVAHRLAAEARGQGARRQARERAGAMRQNQTSPAGAWQELEEVLDQALARLPEKYREAVVFCCLEGKTQEEAARHLGCPLGTVRSRLARGRELLRKQLAAGGVPLSAAALATFLAAGAAPAAVPAAVLRGAARAALQEAAGKAVTAAVPPGALALLEGGRRAVGMTRAKAFALLVALSALAAGAGACAWQALSAKGPAPVEAGGANPRASAPAPGADGEKRERTDSDGAPLPEGALARLGTLRFRHKFDVTHAVFSRDGKALIAADRTGLVLFWDVETGKELRRIPTLYDPALVLAVSPDGKTLAAACHSSMRLWGLATGKLLRQWKSPQMRSLLFSPDGKTLASHGYDGVIHLWAPEGGEKRHELKGHRGSVSAFAFSPDGKQLASVSWGDSVVRVWDVAAGREVRQLKGHARNALAVAWSPDGKTVASTANDNTLRLWDATTGRERARSADHPHGVPAPLAYLPDGSALAGMVFGTVRLYDPATGKGLRSFAQAPHAWGDLAVSPDGKRVACSRGGAHTPALWDVASGKLLGGEGHCQPVRALAFTADAGALFSASSTTEYALRVWAPATGKELRRAQGVSGANALALSPDGRLLAVGHSDKVSLRDPATDREVRRLQHAGCLLSVCFSADGRRLSASSQEGKNVRLWDLATGLPGALIATNQDEPNPAALSPDGKLVAAGGYQDGSVRLWSADSGRELRRLQAGAHSAYAIAFSPDGTLLAVGGWKGTTGLWAPATGKLVRRIDDPSEQIGALAFSPDGRTLALAGDAVRLWEVATGQLHATRTGHSQWDVAGCRFTYTGPVSALAFSRDGRYLASGGIDTTILTWDLAGPAARLTRPRLEALWADLASGAAEAHQAVRALAAAPKQAVPYLGERLRPVAPLTAADRERFARLLADLDRDTFTAREKAAAELEKQGEAVEPLLRRALAGAPGPEVRRRLKKLLGALDAQSPNRLRLLRAVEALEYAGSAEARRLLRELAGGAPEAWLTREAQASLGRLERQSAPPR